MTSSDARRGIGASETLSNALLPGEGTYPSRSNRRRRLECQLLRSRSGLSNADQSPPIDEAARGGRARGQLVLIRLQIAGGDSKTFGLAEQKFFLPHRQRPVFEILTTGAASTAAAAFPAARRSPYYAELQLDGRHAGSAALQRVYAALRRIGQRCTAQFQQQRGLGCRAEHRDRRPVDVELFPSRPRRTRRAATTPASGSCFFTGQGVVGGGIGATDVDSGSTLLTSPAINRSQSGRRYLVLARTPTARRQSVHRHVRCPGEQRRRQPPGRRPDRGPGQHLRCQREPGLAVQNHPILDLRPGADGECKKCFNAQDTDPASLVEAAIDDFSVGAWMQPAGLRTGDLNLDALVDDFDFTVFASAYDKFDCARSDDARRLPERPQQRQPGATTRTSCSSSGLRRSAVSVTAGRRPEATEGA